MKRFLAFLLGIIFGAVILLGGVGISLYSAVTVAHPNEIYPDLKDFVGTLGDTSLLNVYYTLMALYQEKTGITTGEVYTVGQFLNDYEISQTTQNDDGTEIVVAFGIQMPQELLEAPLLEYFNNEVDDAGRNGLRRALTKIKIGTVPAVVNMFGTNEDGSPLIQEEVVRRLNDHNLDELLNGTAENPSTNILSNLIQILDQVSLNDLVPIFADMQNSENALHKLLYAVGQADLGKLLDGVTNSNQNILALLTSDGALSHLGQMQVTDILGNSDALLSSLLGNITFSDFISTEGNFELLNALDKVSLGALLGLTKYEENSLEVNTFTDYADENGQYLFSVTEVNSQYYISDNRASADQQTNWYRAQLTCTENHEHTADCFEYIWYKVCKDTEENGHIHTESDDVFLSVDGKQVAYCLAGPIYSTFATLKVSTLFNDQGAFDIANIISLFDDYDVYSLINDLLNKNDILDKLAVLLELDQVTLSQLLAEGGFDKVFDKVKQIPIVQLLDVLKLTNSIGAIGEFLGDMSLADLADGGFNNISIGDFLGIIKRPVDVNYDGCTINKYEIATTTDTEEQTNYLYVGMFIDEQSNPYYAISNDFNEDYLSDTNIDVTATWYEATLQCIAQSEHKDFEEHTFDCFDYVYYIVCEEDHEHEDEYYVESTGENDAVTKTYYQPANILYSTIGSLTVGDLIGGDDVFGNLMDKLKDLKLGDLFEMFKMTPTGVFLTLSDMSINDLLDGGFNNIAIGSLVGLEKRDSISPAQVTIITITNAEGTILCYVGTINDELVMSDDNENWYYAKNICNDENHDHSDSCYEYLWYQACDIEGCDQTAHSHLFSKDNADYVDATGMMSLIADVTIGDLTSGVDVFGKITNLTLGELFEALKMPVTGMFESLSHLTLQELSDGGYNTLELGSLLNQTTYQNNGTVNNIVEIFDNENNIVAYVGDVEGQLVLSEDSTTWYNAKLSCRTEEHDCSALGCAEDCTLSHKHGKECYSKLWYTVADCQHEGDHTFSCYTLVNGVEAYLANITIGDLTTGNGIDTLFDVPLKELMGKDELDGILATIGDYSINELMDPDTDILGNIMDKITLADAFGGEEKVPQMFKSIQNEKLSNLSNAINDMRVGELLDYKRWELQDVSVENGWTIDGMLATKDDVYALLVEGSSNSAWYRANLDCDCTDDLTHTADCYAVIWYTLCDNTNCTHTHIDIDGNNSKYIATTGIMAKFANYKINELSKMQEIIDDLRIKDVFPTDIPPMLKSIANEKISNLSNALQNVYLGDFLEYSRTEITDKTNLTTTYITDEENNALVIGNGTDFALLENNVWYKATQRCADDTHSEKTHTTNCFAFIWYNKDGLVEDITGKLANEKLSTLNNISTTIQSYSLKDVMGVGVPTMLQSIQDKPISQLSDSIGSIPVADILQFVQHNGEWYQKCENCNHSASDHITIEGMEGTYNKATGITATIANKTVNQLGNIGDEINDMTLEDLLGKSDENNALLNEIYGTKVGELGSSINSLYIGTAMNYTRVSATLGEATANILGNGAWAITIDGYILTDSYDTENPQQSKWYQANLLCNDENHSHTETCFEYLWLDSNDKQATVPNSAFVNCKMDELSSKMSTLTLGELVDCSTSPILASLKNSQIANIGANINNVQVGTAMGLVQNKVDTTGWELLYTDSQGNTIVKQNGDNLAKLYNGEWFEASACTKSTHTHNDTCGGEGVCQIKAHSHSADCIGYVWYEKCEKGCEHDDSLHTVIDEVKHIKSVGINAKMSNLTIGGMQGNAMMDIVKGLTMGEMMESKIFTFAPEQQHKLAIIYCNGTEGHSFSVEEQVLNPITMKFETVTITYECNLWGFLQFASQSDSTTPAQDFFHKCHDKVVDSDHPLSYYDTLWQQETFSEFVSKLLDSMAA